MGGITSSLGTIAGGALGVGASLLSGGAVSPLVGGLLGAGIGSSVDTSNAAQNAAATQSAAAQSGINEQQRQFDLATQLLQPYNATGQNALASQANLMGINGTAAQQQAINALQQSPVYTSMMKSGQNALLQNAAATGGLRGGNTQAALGLLAPQILSSVYQNQLTNLGGLSALGENAAAKTGNNAMASANSISQLLASQGAAQAGGQIASGATGLNALRTGAGMLGLVNGIGGASGLSNLFSGSGGASNIANYTSTGLNGQNIFTPTTNWGGGALTGVFS